MKDSNGTGKQYAYQVTFKPADLPTRSVVMKGVVTIYDLEILLAPYRHNAIERGTDWVSVEEPAVVDGVTGMMRTIMMEAPLTNG